MRILSVLVLFFATTVAPLWGQTAKAASLADLARYMGVDREQVLLAGAKKEGKVVWYSTLTAYKEIARVFEAKYPGVRVEGYRASPEDLIKRVLTEAQARRYLVDAIETTPPALMVFRDNRLLLPYASPHISLYPEDSKEEAPQGLVHWVTDRESFVGLGYNKNSIPASDVPKSFADLLNPSLKGKLALAVDSSGDRIIGAMLKVKGEEFMRKLREQNIKLYTISGGALHELVVSGEVAMSPTIFRNHVLMAIEKGAPVAWVPMDLVTTNAGGAALFAHAQRPHAAVLFVDFLLSPEGQKIMEEKFKFGSPLKDYGFKRWYPEKGLTTAQYEKTANKWRKVMHEIARK